MMRVLYASPHFGETNPLTDPITALSVIAAIKMHRRGPAVGSARARPRFGAVGEHDRRNAVRAARSQPQIAREIARCRTTSRGDLVLQDMAERTVKRTI
jgi:hypothetical protein